MELGDAVGKVARVSIGLWVVSWIMVVVVGFWVGSWETYGSIR